MRLNSETGEITVKEAYTPEFETQDGLQTFNNLRVVGMLDWEIGG